MTPTATAEKTSSMVKVQIQKNLLVDALDKMHDVSTKALLPDFNFSGRVTVKVQSSKVLFISSNGCITIKAEINSMDDPGIDGCVKGSFTTDSVKLRNSVRKIATETPESPLELTKDSNDNILIRDVGSKRKKVVKLPQDNSHHKDSVISKPDGDSLFVETDHFVRAVNTVTPFMSKAGYRPEYQVVCLHWKGDEARFICGDGAIFAVFTAPRHTKDANKKELKRTIPAVQLSVVSGLVQDSSELELVWKEKSTLWMKTDRGIELVVRGIPDIDYIAYHTNAYRFEEAKACADIKVSNLSEVAGLLGVLKDKDREDQHKCHSCCLEIPSSDGNAKFEITKKQGQFQCEYEIPADYYDLGDKPIFKSKYAHLFFESPVGTARNPYLRFYLISEESSGVVNVRDVDLGEPDDDGIPQILDDADGCRLSYFFAAIKDDEEEEEDE